MLDLIEEAKLDWSQMEIDVLEKDTKKMKSGMWEQERVVYDKMCERLKDLKDMKLSEKYKPISLDFMSAHNIVGGTTFGHVAVPKFCPFTQEKNDFSVVVRRTSRPGTESFLVRFNWRPAANQNSFLHQSEREVPSYPSAVNTPLLNAVLETPKMHFWGWATAGDGYWDQLRMTASLSFVVPKEAKRKMAEATEFDQKYIVAEVPEDMWVAKILPAPRIMSDDPLIIGIKGKYAFLIAAFDPTPLESYIMREFLK